MSWMIARKVVVCGLAAVGGLALAALLAYGAFHFATKKRVPSRTVLEADFERGLVEYVPDDPAARVLLARPLVVLDVVAALETGARDGRVAALVARIGAGSMGLAQVQEIRDAVLAFRSGGEPAIAYAETFGEFGPGNAAYYLATAFDEVYLQPSGEVGLTGLIFRRPFLRGSLDKLGILPRVDHRREYKSLKNLLTERGYTEAHREADRAVMESIFRQMVRGIARARGVSEEEVRAAADGGPLSAQEAAKARMVDGLAYRDEVYAKVKEKAGAGARFLPVSEYVGRAGRAYRKGNTVALIYGVGAIQRGRSRYHPVLGRFLMGPDTVSEAFRAAVEDEDVKAILFRVDSPGGSYVASDAILRETIRAKEAGKPVIVSMGNVAGSGGYMVSMAADRIVAQPATVTGSIGVFAGKLVTAGLWEKLGVSWDEVHTGPAASIWTSTRDYTPQQWEKLQRILDRIYEDFTGKTARERKLPLEKVLEIARGRIWTGEDAKELGLVDELGGFPAALRLARERMGLPADAPVRLKPFPPKKSLWARLWRWDAGREEAALAGLFDDARPLARAAAELGLGGPPGVLYMPEPGEPR